MRLTRELLNELKCKEIQKKKKTEKKDRHQERCTEMVPRNKIKKVKVQGGFNTRVGFKGLYKGILQVRQWQKRMGRTAESRGVKDNNNQNGKGQRTPCLVCIVLQKE